MQKQLDSSPPADTYRRMSELEGALKQAVKDYELLLHELANIREDARQKEVIITELQARLANATDASVSQRCAWHAAFEWRCCSFGGCCSGS
jgi:hypothetical protein